MILGGGMGSSDTDSFSLYLDDSWGSEACLDFSRLNRCGSGITSSFRGSSSSFVVLSIGTEWDWTFSMPVLVVALVPGREADCSSLTAIEFLRDISSGSPVRKWWKLVSRPSWAGANERLSLLSDPTVL